MSMNFVHDFSIKETCLAPIDVQGMFCNPKYFSLNKWYQPWMATERTDTVAKRISNIAPDFNTQGVDVAWIYYTNKFDAKKPFKLAGNFHEIIPHKDDAIIPKIESSAFDEEVTPFEKWLVDNEKEHILLCGFYLTACVYWTAVHAAFKGYKVTVLTDMSADGRRRGHEEKSHKQCLNDFADVVSSSPKYISSNIRFGRSAEVLNIYKARTLSVA